MPEDMSIWQGRNVSCDVLQLLADGFMKRDIFHKTV